MKKTLRIFALLTVLVLLAVNASAATSKAITNGGFEGDNVGNAYSNDGATVLEISKDMAASGKSCLKVTNRSNEWGAVAFDVTEYMKNCGDGKYYCTFYVSGDFDGAVRATLHTNHQSGADVYRNIAVMTEFKTGKWSYVGADANGKPLAIGAENWNIDYSEWDKEIVTDLNNATLYFWIEGNNNGTVYFDNMSFWGNNDIPEFAPNTSDSFAAIALLLASVAAGAVVVCKKH